LADWVGAAKMGLDPYTSPLNAYTFRQLGLPADFAIDGDLTPYPLWRNPHPWVTASVRTRNRSALAARVARPLSQPVNREVFPFKDLAVDRLNAYLTAQSPGEGDLSGGASWWAAPFNFLVGGIAGVVRAFQTMYQKRHLPWVEVPLQFDPHGLAQADYDGIRPFVEGLEQMVRDAPTDRFGHQWRVVEGAVLFRARHLLAVPFDTFVAKVEIHRSIQFMNDYLGGSAVVLGRTGDGRVARQAERNVYLPQPNWTALFGATPIDVEKTEIVAYDKDWQRIWWRTVHSPNQSALWDDGSVEFRRSSDGRTAVTIFTRQKFHLPPALGQLRVEQFPSLYEALVASAYNNFVVHTLENLRRQAEDRPFRIGHPAREQGYPGGGLLTGDLAAVGAAVAGSLMEFVSKGPGWVKELQRVFSTPPRPTNDGRPDENGFRHFNGPPANGPPPRTPAGSFGAWARAAFAEAPKFFHGLSDALQKDVVVAMEKASRESP
jgi:hypothetical protein